MDDCRNLATVTLAPILLAPIWAAFQLSFTLV
jgi:hypothetical protein